MIEQCPGQDRRKVTIELVKCQQCGYGLEIFSDEISAACPACKTLVCKERLPSCVDWCLNARQCVGEYRWAQLRAKP